MDVVSHLFVALGRMLLWLASALMLEELTFAGLARLLVTVPCERKSRGVRVKRFRSKAVKEECHAGN